MQTNVQINRPIRTHVVYSDLWYPGDTEDERVNALPVAPDEVLDRVRVILPEAKAQL